MVLSFRLEDYLEALFELESSGRKQTVSALAKSLSLTKGTVVSGIKKIVELNLADHAAYGNIRLTDEGRRIGWRTFMKHERLKAFFHDFLNADVQKADEIACLVEHHFRGEAGERFFNLVNFLYAARESNEAWADELFSALQETKKMPEPLTLWSGGEGIICRLGGTEENNQKLIQGGLKNGTIIKSVSVNEAKKTYQVITENATVSVSAEDAATVWVKRANH